MLSLSGTHGAAQHAREPENMVLWYMRLKLDDRSKFPDEGHSSHGGFRGFFAWANKNGFTRQQRDFTQEEWERQKHTLTHNSMDSGPSLVMPFGRAMEGYHWYAMDVKHRGPDSGFPLNHWVVERPTKHIRLVFEFDYKKKTCKATMEEMLGHAKICLAVVADLFPDVAPANRRLIVMSHDGHVVIPRQGMSPMLYKSGAHFVFPDIVIDQNMGRTICEQLQMEFRRRRKSEHIFESSLDQAIDSSIYTVSERKGGSGLRLAYSLKKDEACKQCEPGQRLSTNWGTCKHGRGGRVYKPFAVLDHEGAEMPDQLATLQDDPFLCVMSTCFQMGDASDTDLSPLDMTKLKDPHGVDLPPSLRFGGGGGAGSGDCTTEIVPRTSRLWDPIDKACRMAYGRDPMLEKIERITFSNGNTVYRATSRSKWCVNKKADHSNNRVYMVLNERSIKVKCYCTKPIIRESGTSCAEYNKNPEMGRISLRDEFRREIFSTGAVRGKRGTYSPGQDMIMKPLSRFLVPRDRIEAIVKHVDIQVLDESARKDKVSKEIHGGGADKASDDRNNDGGGGGEGRQRKRTKA